MRAYERLLNYVKVLSLKMVFAMVSSCQGTNFWW